MGPTLDDAGQLSFVELTSFPEGHRVWVVAGAIYAVEEVPRVEYVKGSPKQTGATTLVKTPSADFPVLEAPMAVFALMVQALTPQMGPEDAVGGWLTADQVSSGTGGRVDGYEAGERRIATGIVANEVLRALDGRSNGATFGEIERALPHRDPSDLESVLARLVDERTISAAGADGEPMRYYWRRRHVAGRDGIR